MMGLEEKAKKKINGLLEMASNSLEEMSSRWNELEQLQITDSTKSKEFSLGFIFGKMEHKFINWFYSEFGRAQTDEEYKEFLDLVNNWNFSKDPK